MLDGTSRSRARSSNTQARTRVVKRVVHQYTRVTRIHISPCARSPTPATSLDAHSGPRGPRDRDINATSSRRFAFPQTKTRRARRRGTSRRSRPHARARANARTHERTQTKTRIVSDARARATGGARDRTRGSRSDASRTVAAYADRVVSRNRPIRGARDRA